MVIIIGVFTIIKQRGFQEAQALRSRLAEPITIPDIVKACKAYSGCWMDTEIWRSVRRGNTAQKRYVQMETQEIKHVNHFAAARLPHRARKVQSVNKRGIEISRLGVN